MRYIGNKTKLLEPIEQVLRDRGVTGGTLVDIFTGSASVARHFKRRGFRVLANDIMSVAHTQAVAALEVSSHPRFERFFEERPDATAESLDVSPEPVETFPLRAVVRYINERVEPREGLIFRAFCPGGKHDRRYFRDEAGRKIDGVLAFLEDAHRRRVFSTAEFHLLLAALIDAADRRANISGTYGAYLKSWQSNTRGELLLDVPEIIESSVDGHRAYRGDSLELVGSLRGDVLYIDPPYNKRQYPANYHVLEVIAEHHRIPDLEAYERELYGKTGLRPYGDLVSEFCLGAARRPRVQGIPEGREFRGVREAFASLVERADVDHIVVSYNEEGLLGRDEIGAILARYSGDDRYNFEENFTEVLYRRFRSDRDRARNGDGDTQSRSYRLVEGKDKDQVGEWLFYARRRGVTANS